MPELPDVQVYKQYLDATSLHKTIKNVKVEDSRVLSNVTPGKLRNRLKGHKIESSRRHGKYLLAFLDAGFWLSFHFGMTGRLKYFKKMEKDPAHDRVLLSFVNGYHLAYVSQRMLGELEVVEDREEFIKKKEMGEDALSIDLESFTKVVKGRRGSIKSTLMNQKLIAGIGNIYADEILFHSRIHPKTQASKLREGDFQKIFNNMTKVLEKAIRCQVDPERFPDSYLLPHRHQEGKCPRSHGNLETVKISGRTAYFCPRCQAQQ
ncbi:MAG: Fpg/Nei family DNA glycosylase [Candidatus Aminicenantes bacterium]